MLFLLVVSFLLLIRELLVLFDFSFGIVDLIRRAKNTYPFSEDDAWRYFFANESIFQKKRKCIRYYYIRMN